MIITQEGVKRISAIPKWIDESCLGDFPDEYQLLAAEIGFGNMLKMVVMNQGTSVYYPRLDWLIARVRNRQILKEFNGSNLRQLALEYGLTERWVYHILAEQKKGQ